MKRIALLWILKYDTTHKKGIRDNLHFISIKVQNENVIQYVIKCYEIVLWSLIVIMLETSTTNCLVYNMIDVLDPT